MTADWHNAQVIEATTPEGLRGFMIGGADDGVWWWCDWTFHYHRNFDLSDVRVVVDADGRVAPPPVTEEMVDIMFRAAGNGFLLRADRDRIRAALEFVALGGGVR